MVEVADIRKTHKKFTSVKRKVVIPLLVILTGVFVYITADVQKQVMSMFLGSVAGFSLLTIIFFVANMTKEQTWKQAVKPYVLVFGMLLIWSLIFAGLRLVLKF